MTFFDSRASYIRAWPALALASVLACSTPPEDPDVQDRSCSAGERRSCSCDDGQDGVKRCTSGEFGACDCELDAGRPERDAKSATKDATKDPVDGALPCDVSAVLAEHCQSCHGTRRQFGAPVSLVSYGDLHAETDAKKMYNLVVERIHDTERPMPPSEGLDRTLPAAAREVLERWAAAGAPSGTASCDTRVDAGAPDAAIQDPVPEGPEDCENVYELRAHGPAGRDAPYTVPAAQGGAPADRYQCFYFKPPYGADARGLWFAPVLDNTPVLHHWLLYGVDNMLQPDGSSAPCSAAEPGAYLLAGWAPGANEVSLPKDVELLMPTGPTAGVFLEMHYYNTEQEAAPDRTGVRFCTAKPKTREHLAAVHFTGSEAICIQPGAKGHEVKGVCNPRRDMDDGKIHMINLWPHMHKLGRRMKIVIKRANGTVETLHDKPFRFEQQIQYWRDDSQPERWTLNPGDTMETSCYFDNPGTTAVPFGEKTSSEMCFGFVTAWPAGSLTTRLDTLNPVQFVGLGLQPALRCLDPTGLFGSCAGLGNYPLPGLP